MSLPASSLRNYALVVETSPEALVASVSKGCADGFQPFGGVAMAREPANAAKGMPVGVTRYAQAMIKLARPGEELIVNGR